MNAIDACFARLRERGRKAFIAFLPAGDPDITATPTLGRTLALAGADLIEIGFPFSDPIADGPVIQASYTRALNRKVKLAEVFAAIAALHADPALTDVPLIGMVSFSLVYRRGVERFAAEAKAAGLSGLIVPDLPAEEAETLTHVLAPHDLKLILLVTPLTTPTRAEQILSRCGGFVYCVSVAGITGERDQLPPALLEQLAQLRTKTPLPLCVGFGVSKPTHARMLRPAADGIIVGSALVRLIEHAERDGLDTVCGRLRELVGTLGAALNDAPPTS